MINRELLNNFKADFKEVVKELEEKYNLSISLSKITYQDMSFYATLKAADMTSGMSIDQMEWNENCIFYDLSSDDYEKTFTYRGETYKFKNINTKARKLPIVIERLSDNQRLRISLEDAKMWLNQSKAKASATN